MRLLPLWLTSLALCFAQLAEAREAIPATDASPLIAAGRPYTQDLLGWFDDFSTTGGGFDALGAYAKGQIGFQESVFNKLPGLEAVRTGEYKNCPGSAEAPAPDGSNVFSAQEQQEMGCEEASRGVKP